MVARCAFFGHERPYLGEPSLLDVLIGVGVHYRKAKKEDVRLGVGEGSNSGIALLP